MLIAGLSQRRVSGLAQAAVIENTWLYLLCLRVSLAGLLVHPPSEKRGSERRKSGWGESRQTTAHTKCSQAKQYHYRVIAANVLDNMWALGVPFKLRRRWNLTGSTISSALTCLRYHREQNLWSISWYRLIDSIPKLNVGKRMRIMWISIHSRFLCIYFNPVNSKGKSSA